MGKRTIDNPKFAIVQRRLNPDFAPLILTYLIEAVSLAAEDFSLSDQPRCPAFFR